MKQRPKAELATNNTNGTNKFNKSFVPFVLFVTNLKNSGGALSQTQRCEGAKLL